MLEQRIALVEAPPLEELDTVGQQKHIWFTNGSSMVIKGKWWIKYTAINLEEVIIQDYLHNGSAQHAELHAIYQVLKQYENSPRPVYIYAEITKIVSKLPLGSFSLKWCAGMGLLKLLIQIVEMHLWRYAHLYLSPQNHAVRICRWEQVFETN